MPWGVRREHWTPWSREEVPSAAGTLLTSGGPGPQIAESRQGAWGAQVTPGRGTGCRGAGPEGGGGAAGRQGRSGGLGSAAPGAAGGWGAQGCRGGCLECRAVARRPGGRRGPLETPPLLGPAPRPGEPRRTPPRCAHAMPGEYPSASRPASPPLLPPRRWICSGESPALRARSPQAPRLPCVPPRVQRPALRGADGDGVALRSREGVRAEPGPRALRVLNGPSVRPTPRSAVRWFSGHPIAGSPVPTQIGSSRPQNFRNRVPLGFPKFRPQAYLAVAGKIGEKPPAGQQVWGGHVAGA